MRHRTGKVFTTAVIAVITLAGLLFFSGCASVEHVRLYRDARADFSLAANKDNLETLGNLFPDPQKLNQAETPLDASWKGAQESMERWDAVLATFTALNKQKKSELAQDDLLGSSLTLQAMAQLHRDLHAHVLGAASKTIMPPAERGTPVAIPPQTLTTTLAQAEELATNGEVKLFARDLFVLKSLRPMVRYQIAYLNALREIRKLQGKASSAVYLPLVEQMALAEQELTATPDCPGHMNPYVTLSRYIMLLSAQNLVQHPKRAGIRLPLSEEESLHRGSSALILLHKRVHHFNAEAGKADTPESALLVTLGLKVTDLVDVGLRPIAR